MQTKWCVITYQIEPVILEAAQPHRRIDFDKSLPSECSHDTLKYFSDYLRIPFPMNLSAGKPCAGI